MTRILVERETLECEPLISRTEFCVDGRKLPHIWFHDATDPTCATNQYHELFLHPSTSESFLTPLFFEHGMDIVECKSYYDLMAAQELGGVVRELPEDRCRRVDTNSLRHPTRDFPVSILRKHEKKIDTSIKSRKRLLRRFSFSGFHRQNDDDSLNAPRLMRCSSMRNVQDIRRTVTFSEHAQVFPVYALEDIPYEIRLKLWMSRGEMMVCALMAAQRRQDPSADE